MPGSSSLWSLTQRDYDKEPTTTEFRLPQLTLLNLTDNEAGISSLKSAIAGITIGLQATDQLRWSKDQMAAPDEGATSKLAQRENKWLIRYYDSTTFTPGTYTIGCADLTLLSGHSDTIDLTTPPSGVWTTFKSAFEGLIESEEGHAVIATSAQMVGRNT